MRNLVGTTPQVVSLIETGGLRMWVTRCGFVFIGRWANGYLLGTHHRVDPDDVPDVVAHFDHVRSASLLPS